MAISKITANALNSPLAGINVDGGTIKLDGNYPVGSENTALGNGALDDGSLTGGNNVAIGSNSLTANTSGATNVGVGVGSLFSNSSGSNNIAIGYQSLLSNSTASNNTAVGYQAGYTTTTGASNTAIGRQAGYAIGTGTTNTLIGDSAGANGSNYSYTVGVGYRAAYNVTSGINNSAFGIDSALSLTTGNENTFVGRRAGVSATTGSNNTFIGSGATDGAGAAITTGSKNTIIGGYDGNQGGLDIRTSDNNIVLSDGDGNPRLNIDSLGRLKVSNAIAPNSFDWNLAIDTSNGNKYGLAINSLRNNTGGSGGIVVRRHETSGESDAMLILSSGNSDVGSIRASNSGTSFNTTSDYRLKENLVDLTDGITRLKQLPVHRFNFISDPDVTVDGFLAHEAQEVVPEAVSGVKDAVKEDGTIKPQAIDQSKLVPLLTAALKEAIARIEALENA